ncbi:hypothetical protein [Thermomonas sp.]|uniref:hypothetical protein n=1 Tax=Thermomonas sp. TaxID=1971895 RepID=UPI00391B6B58
MSMPVLENLSAQWSGNRRLRMAVLVALVVLTLHMLDGLSRYREAAMQAQASDARLMRGLAELAAQPEWVARAKQAETELEVLRRQMRTVSSAGQVQAEIQVWLTEFAKTQNLANPTVKVQEVLDVPGHPTLVQVLARLDGNLPAFSQRALVRGLAAALPWIQVERLEIGDQGAAKLSLVVRAYYRRAPGVLSQDATAAEASP